MHLRSLSGWLLCGLLLSGCMNTGDIYVSVPLADGTSIRVPMSGPPPQPVKNDLIQIVAAGFGIKPGDDSLIYRFDFRTLKPVTVRRVTIEDLADEKPLPILDDTSPKITDDRWSGSVPSLTIDDPRIAWIRTIQNSIRVYRFTIETDDGRKSVLLQPTIVPSFAKEMLRRKLGATY